MLIPADVSLGLADLHGLFGLPAAVCGLFALPAVVHGLPALPAVSLDLADLCGLFALPARGLPALPAVSLDLADIVGGTYAGMLSSRFLFLECFGISVLST